MKWIRAFFNWCFGTEQRPPQQSVPASELQAPAKPIKIDTVIVPSKSLTEEIREQGNREKFLAELKSINPHNHREFATSDDILKELKRIASDHK